MSIGLDQLEPQYNDRRIQEFISSGWLYGLYKAVELGCTNSFDARRNRFEEAHLNDRVKGDDRWNHVDQELIHFANRFDFELIWVPVGRSGHPHMLFLRHDNLLISAHQVVHPGDAAPFAKHRDVLMLPPPGQMVYTEDQILRLIEHDGVEYWQMTYQRTSERTPLWMILGRPVMDRKKLHYQSNVYAALGVIHPAEEFPNFNPTEDRPAARFTLPEEWKREGEGES